MTSDGKFFNTKERLARSGNGQRQKKTNGRGSNQSGLNRSGAKKGRAAPNGTSLVIIEDAFSEWVAADQNGQEVLRRMKGRINKRTLYQLISDGFPNHKSGQDLPSFQVRLARAQQKVMAGTEGDIAKRARQSLAMAGVVKRNIYEILQAKKWTYEDKETGEIKLTPEGKRLSLNDLVHALGGVQDIEMKAFGAGDRTLGAQKLAEELSGVSTEGTGATILLDRFRVFIAKACSGPGDREDGAPS